MGRTGQARKWIWRGALVSAPAMAGAISFWIFETGDFRSSGLIAGVALSIALAAAAMAARWWRNGRSDVRGFLVSVVLGAVGAFGLVGGVPEFVQAMGLFVDVRALGPRAIVSVGDRLVIVGNDRTGPFVASSEDGESWTHISTPAFAGLVIRDAVSSYGSVVVLAAREEPTEAVLLSSPDGAWWSDIGRFGNASHGTWPATLSAVADSYVAVTSTIGNDVEFYETNDLSNWEVVGAPGVFDDGESSDDIACRIDECVAVGYWDADYRRDIADDRGVAWARSSGFAPVVHDFEAERLTSVAAASGGFVVVGEGIAETGSVLWTSVDGSAWKRAERVFDGRRITGVEALGDVVFAHGWNPASSGVVVWNPDPGGGWREETVEDGLTDGSEIRALARRGEVVFAVGVEGNSTSTLVWTRQENGRWTRVATVADA